MVALGGRSAAAVMGEMGKDGRVPALCLSHVSPEGVSAENTVVL